ncbi:hypothetical protein [Brevundimonas nasdae]|uniref:hypothetical protein n=1 Tax=Brevundimonas nasdae TaxID=172043 RepID=UPI003019F8F5
MVRTMSLIIGRSLDALAVITVVLALGTMSRELGHLARFGRLSGTALREWANITLRSSDYAGVDAIMYAFVNQYTFAALLEVAAVALCASYAMGEWGIRAVSDREIQAASGQLLNKSTGLH